jgi:Na+-driven multidrug efflux pump
MMGGLGILFISIPGHILRLFTPDADIIHAAIAPLRLLGIMQFFDAIGMVYHGALRGAGDNTFLAIADLSLMWLILLPTTYFAGVYLNGGIMGAWLALAAYIAGYATMAHLRFRFGPWRKIVV